MTDQSTDSEASILGSDLPTITYGAMPRLLARAKHAAREISWLRRMVSLPVSGAKPPTPTSCSVAIRFSAVSPSHASEVLLVVAAVEEWMNARCRSDWFWKR